MRASWAAILDKNALAHTADIISLIIMNVGDLCFVTEHGMCKWPCKVVNITLHAVTIRYIDPRGAHNNIAADFDASAITPYKGEKGNKSMRAHLRAAYNAIYKVGYIVLLSPE